MASLEQAVLPSILLLNEIVCSLENISASQELFERVVHFAMLTDPLDELIVKIVHDGSLSDGSEGRDSKGFHTNFVLLTN